MRRTNVSKREKENMLLVGHSFSAVIMHAQTKWHTLHEAAYPKECALHRRPHRRSTSRGSQQDGRVPSSHPPAPVNTNTLERHLAHLYKLDASGMGGGGGGGVGGTSIIP